MLGHWGREWDWVWLLTVRKWFLLVGAQWFVTSLLFFFTRRPLTQFLSLSVTLFLEHDIVVFESSLSVKYFIAMQLHTVYIKFQSGSVSLAVSFGRYIFFYSNNGGGGGGGYSQKNWAGLCGPLPKTLTLFMTKICEFVSLPEIQLPIYSRCGWHSSPKHNLWRAFDDGLIASSILFRFAQPNRKHFYYK